MTPDQEEAIQRAKETMAPALALYAERNKLAVLVGKLELRDLIRLNLLLARLTDEELRQVARFAEGLAEWREPEQQSGDAAVSQG